MLEVVNTLGKGREHGYAVIGSVDDVGRRMAYHYEIKGRVAQAAVESIQDGEVVMIESGSCNIPD
jgi:DeoR/GlpR family transcriptional regulator of sugar metabolism